jgi:hypothetical protein
MRDAHGYQAASMKFGDKIKTALDETRMLILGAQILLGFGFRSVFQDAFDDLPLYSRVLDGVALMLIVVTVGLLITPEPYHRIAEEGRDTGSLHHFVSRMANSSLLPFAGGLAIAMFIASERIFGIVGGLIAGFLFLGLSLTLWFGVEYLRRRHAGKRERAIFARQKSMHEDTPLDQRIIQMLTEARVILPGAQALLGFQLAITITRSFAALPESSQIVHGASLGCIALAIVLLMAPAAYHRIVFGGEDTEEMYRVGGWLVTAATVPLAFGLAGDVYVAIAKIADSWAIGAITSAATLLLLVGLWYLLPIAVRLRRAAAGLRRASTSGMRSRPG